MTPTNPQVRHPIHQVDDFKRPPPLPSTSSRRSSHSIKSTTESLNDFLDLYADEESSEDEPDAPLFNTISNAKTPPLKTANTQSAQRTSENTKLALTDVIQRVISDSSENKENINTDYRESPATTGTSTPLAESNVISHKVSSSILEPEIDFATDANDRVAVGRMSSIIPAADTVASDILANETFENDTFADDNVADNTIIDSSNIFNETITSKNDHILDDRIASQNESIGHNSDIGIDATILDLIDKLGNRMGSDDELQIDLLPASQGVLSDSLNCQNLLPHEGENYTTDIDFLTVDMSSEDEDYEDDHRRFKSFFGMDGFISSTNSLYSHENDMEQAETAIQVLNEDHDTVAPEDDISTSVRDAVAENEIIRELNISAPPGFHVLDERISMDLPSDDPPPYTETDEIQMRMDEKIALQLQEQETNQSKNYGSNGTFSDSLELQVNKQRASSLEATPSDFVLPVVNNSCSSASSRCTSSSATTSNSPLKRKISIKLRKTRDGELSRHTSVDYYQMDKFLPPYRSLINPNKAFDYRTNTYINAKENDIEITSGSDNKPIIAIHRKRRDSNRIMSMLLTTNNNIKQKIIDAGDTLSIKSRSVSIRSLSSIQQQSMVKTKYKATAKFTDLSEDIHRRIVDCIDNQRDLVNCLYVSHAFNMYATPNLYKYPKFTSTYRLGQFVHTIINKPTLSQYVKVFDLSKIALPVSLDEAETKKYQDKLIYGSSTARDVLNDKTKVVYASWRDWKYRAHPLYGDGNRWRRRANSGSTVSSGSTIGTSFESMINPNISAPNLMDTSKYKSTGNITTGNTRARSNSQVDKMHNSKTRTRSSSVNNIIKYKNSNGNKSGSGYGAGTFAAQNSNDNFVKSFKKAFGLETPVETKKKKAVTSTRKEATRETLTSKQHAPVAGVLKKTGRGSKPVKENKLGIAFDLPVAVSTPFSTPHPKMNTLLKQYCFNRDIPVGHIIHVINECPNLEELNFNNMVVSTDYEIKDYASFDWSLGTGKRVHDGAPAVVLDGARPVFWSDTDRDLNFEEDAFVKGYADDVELKNVWPLIMRLTKIKRLKLGRINSLEQSIIFDFVMKSEFKSTLMYMDCSKSGMVKRKEWDQLKRADDWREYFQSGNS